MQRRSLKILMIILASTSLLSLIFAGPIPQLMQWLNPHMWLGLSKWGLSTGFVWQTVTYAFLPPLDRDASIHFLLHTVFILYLLWMVGTSLMGQKGIKQFWILFLGGALTGGLITSILLLTGQMNGLLAGWSPALYALFMGWMLLNPHARILVFFAIPMKVQWVVLIGAAFNLYTDLTNGFYLQCVACSGALLFGYLYAIWAWEIVSPFPTLHKFERRLWRLKKKRYPFTVERI